VPNDGILARHLAPSPLPRILVLLAAYDGEEWIDAQIRSVLRQVSVDVQILVRDDGSSDATVAKLTKFASSEPKIRLTVADRASGSAAQNFFALIRATDAEGFDFVALCDQDDIWNDDKLHQAAEILNQTGSSGYSSAVTATWATGKTRVLRQNSSATESDFLFEGAGQGCTFVLSLPFYRRLRSFLIDHRLSTENAHFHDWATYALARTWQSPWAFDPRPTMQYRQHANNDTGARFSLPGVLKRLSLIRQGWYRTQLQAISGICSAASATDPVALRWRGILHEAAGWRRRIRIVKFCIKGGRRRSLDNFILILAALAGWI
jgi:rhamnosyltransferase